MSFFPNKSTGSPRSYPDTAAYGGMMYNTMHPSGTASDYYGRTQGKDDQNHIKKFTKIYHLPTDLIHPIFFNEKKINFIENPCNIHKINLYTTSMIVCSIMLLKSFRHFIF